LIRMNVIPIVDTMPADLLTPLSVYLKLAGEGRCSFLLESVEGGEALARYSFIGADPHAIIAGGRKRVTITTGTGTTEIQTPLWTYLREHFAGLDAAADPELPSFIGGAIGYFGFNCSSWFEPSLLNDDPSKTDAEFMFFRSIVAFDHAKQTIKLISLVFETEPTDPYYDPLGAARARNSELGNLLENGQINLPGSAGAEDPCPAMSGWPREDFEQAVRRVKEYIAAGDCYQAVLSQRFSRKTAASPVAIYRAVRSLNPSPYMFLLQFPDKAIIGASPEMLVRARGTDLEYRPIAGTRPRGRTQAEDLSLAEEMRADPKETAEHQMLVDLGRNDLGRIAKYGSVRVDRLMSVEKYSHVQHLVSCLSAQLRPGFDRFDAFAACFPAGTVSGAPKVRAIEIIKGLEPSERGVYAGAVGYFDYSGNMDTCIAIRTLVLEDGTAFVQAGAGIVADSVPSLEYDETVNKAKAMLRAVDIAEGRP